MIETLTNPVNLALLGFVAANFLVAMSGAFFKPGAWYKDLRKPSWVPPNWLFGPVWMVLYGMNAFAGWLVWQKVGFEALAVVVYLLQLAFNAFWSAAFFGLRNMRLALYDAGLLWLAVAANIAVFAQFDTRAALLLVPYLCWSALAFTLNYRMVQLNPAATRQAEA
ncbi:TspO/MBR family protein [Algihabitans albus]|uniref:TspO/MBR family protein n=1 Tax=Algihabitans albus TaxID=2164067 RepID=UPI001F38FD85|nr:TspO/MBR family protein [Algihabitans albus]